MDFEKGIDDGHYNPKNEKHQYVTYICVSTWTNKASHRELCAWLWSKLLQHMLDDHIEAMNGKCVRKDKTKAGPSGMSWNVAFSLPHLWGGRDCLLPLSPEQLKIVEELKEAMGGEKLLEFVSEEFLERARQVYNGLNIRNLTLKNAWDVFLHMYPLVFPEGN